MGKYRELRNDIKKDMLESLGVEEIKHYYNDYWNKKEIDYNIAQYGNLLIYYCDVRELFEKHDYKVKNYSDTTLWDMYRGLVGKIARAIVLRGER